MKIMVINNGVLTRIITLTKSIGLDGTHSLGEMPDQDKNGYLTNTYSTKSGPVCLKQNVPLKENTYYAYRDGVLDTKTNYWFNFGLNIPDGVTAIAIEALAGNDDFIHVETPPSLKVIGKRAFASCENLVSVQLNEGLIDIGANVFESPTQLLMKVSLPKSIEEINYYNHSLFCCPDLFYDGKRYCLSDYSSGDKGPYGNRESDIRSKIAEHKKIVEAGKGKA